MGDTATAMEALWEGMGSATTWDARMPVAVLRRDQADVLVRRRIQRPLVAAATTDTPTPPRGHSHLRHPSSGFATWRSRSNQTPPGSPNLVLPVTALVLPLIFDSPTTTGMECSQLQNASASPPSLEPVEDEEPEGLGFLFQ
ncbi:hypothetical protein D1007_29161 [Hordeum vulgare]|nr:hypothetical protein D1007_29161 [Hordeum vulgare]